MHQASATLRTAARASLIGLLVVGLGYFYYAAAVEHAARVNTVKSRGDQSAYLAEAKLVHFNWTGANNPPILQPRNRMPLYPAFLALFYDRAWSDDEFFVHAKQQSIALSLGLLVVVGIVAARRLPALGAANFVLVLAFGYYVFKAGYTQSELLYYTLHFLTFVGMVQLLRSQSVASSLGYATLVGLLAALAHLTKASILPLVVLFLCVYVTREAVALIQTRRVVVFAGRVTAAALLALVFVGVLSPYLVNSKRVHGQYFYNLATSAVVWYDNYPKASVAILDYGPNGWPKGPRRMRPGPVRYWQEHTLPQIAARFEAGFKDMVVRSYHTFWYFKFVALYLLMSAVVAATTWGPFRTFVRKHLAVVVFCGLYGVVYVLATAFYEPISGTGTTRFLLAHIAPLLFALSALLAAGPFRDRMWTIGPTIFTLRHFELLVLAIMVLDVTFVLWWRLMNTYGGF